MENWGQDTNFISYLGNYYNRLQQQGDNYVPRGHRVFSVSLTVRLQRKVDH